MKVSLAYTVNALSGKKDGVVYCHIRDTGVTYLRRYTKPRVTVQQLNFRAVQKNLWKIHPSEAYKNDLRQYIAIFNETRPNRLAPYKNWRNAWLVMMYELQRLFPGVDLTTLTRQQIYTDNLPCINVAAAIQANLIPFIADSGSLVNDI